MGKKLKSVEEKKVPTADQIKWTKIKLERNQNDTPEMTAVRTY